MKNRILYAPLALCLLVCGCTADVQTTDDATRVTVETPKVETSGQQPDLNPATDDDVDIDTPLPGDR
jgi:hypothetical protein